MEEKIRELLLEREFYYKLAKAYKNECADVVDQLKVVGDKVGNATISALDYFDKLENDALNISPNKKGNFEDKLTLGWVLTQIPDLHFLYGKVVELKEQYLKLSDLALNAQIMGIDTNLSAQMLGIEQIKKYAREDVNKFAKMRENIKLKIKR